MRTPAAKTRADGVTVLEVVAEHVDPDQWRHVRQQLPQEIAELFPAMSEEPEARSGRHRPLAG